MGDDVQSRRRTPRKVIDKRCSVTISIISGGSIIPVDEDALVDDINISGMQIIAREFPFDPGDICELTLRLPAGKRIVLIEGKVQWQHLEKTRKRTERYRAGVLFLNLSDIARKEIEHYISTGSHQNR